MPTEMEHLDFQSRHIATLRAEELETRHGSYLQFHTEFREVMHEFMQALLVHKPDDALQFMHDYFAAHREKREPYKVK